MTVPFLDLKAQYHSLKTEMDRAFQDVCERSAFALGPYTEAFEKAFAAYCGTDHCVGVGSGTAAIELLLRARGIGPGDEVITVANTFFASAEAISLAGATPVLIDCHRDDALMDTAQIEAAITAKTKAIIPVHLYGQMADMDVITDVAKAHKLLVIEDACQAHGSRYKGKRAGSLGQAAAFSFYPGKNLGAYGEAGAVTTSDATLAEKVRILRDHGMPRKYEHRFIGRNDRMDGLQGAVLSVKLPHLDRWNAARRAHAEEYRRRIQDVPGITLFTAYPDREQNFHLFVIRTNTRDALQKYLQERGIATGIHYPIPIHLQEAYAGHGWKQGDFPVAEKFSRQILSLPMFPELTEAQIEEVSDAIASLHARGMSA